jgi:hypothetical protein
MKYVLIFLFFASIEFYLRADAEYKKKLYVDKAKQLQHKLDSVTYQLDSVRYELFPIEVELNRHKVAYEIFMQRNPLGASQYGNIISNETE